MLAGKHTRAKTSRLQDATMSTVKCGANYYFINVKISI